jgi:hypothetical protein
MYCIVMSNQPFVISAVFGPFDTLQAALDYRAANLTDDEDIIEMVAPAP